MESGSISRGRLTNRYFLSVAAVGFIYNFAINSGYTSFSLYIDYLGEGTELIGLVGILTLIAGITGRVVSAYTTDNIGRRFTMVLGCLLYAISVFLTGALSAIPLIVAVRSLQGGCFAIANTGSAAANVDASPPEKLGAASSVFYAVSTLGLIICGPLVVFFTDRNAYFEFYALIAVALLLGALLAFTCNYEKKPEYQALREKSGEKAEKLRAIDRFFYRGALRAAVISILLCVAFSLVLNYIFLFGSRNNIAFYGQFFTLGATIALVCNIIGPRLGEKLSPLAVILPCFTFFAAALLFLGITGSAIAYFTCAAAYGVTFGLCFPALYTLAMERAPVDRRGAAGGTLLIANDVGYGVGALIWGVVIGAFDFPAAFIIAGLIMAPTIALSAVLLKK